MANKIFNTRVKNKRDTEANWTSKNPVLLNGEIAIVDTTSGETRFKVGDGTKRYSQLSFQDAATLANYVKTTRKINNKALSSDISLTASDVGALPSTTTALKNPHALTFTGAVIGSYDGSAEKSVAIPSVDSDLSSTSTNAIQNKAVNTALSGKLNTSGGTIVGDLNVTQSSVDVGFGGNLYVENGISSGSVTTTDVSAVSVSSTTLKTTGATNLNAQVTKVAVLDGNGKVCYRTITDLFNDMVETNSVWAVAYPVGSIYMSTSSTSPKTLFGGGTWVQIKDRFLLAAGTTYKAGATGGEATHTLTVDEIANHRHVLWYPNEGGEQSAAIGYPEAGSKKTWYAEASKTGDTGGGEAHNNMPPYLAVYVWKRTA